MGQSFTLKVTQVRRLAHLDRSAMVSLGGTTMGMGTDFSGAGDLLGGQGQPRRLDEETGASLADSAMGSLSIPGVQMPEVSSGDGPQFDPTITEIDPDQGELFPGTGPGDYTFTGSRPGGSATEGWVPPSSIPPSLADDPYAKDCDPKQARIRVICDSGTLTQVLIYNDNELVYSTTAKVGTGGTAPPDKSHCGDFTRVVVKYDPGHATFHFSTNRKLAKRPG
jgi:hypothetical protein